MPEIIVKVLCTKADARDRALDLLEKSGFDTNRRVKGPDFGNGLVWDVAGVKDFPSYLDAQAAIDKMEIAGAEFIVEIRKADVKHEMALAQALRSK
ncbi:MAG: hypothetical protein KGH59_03255 [Candidatus Micrarchaeota archaeon]|nr:hypothetical protein [Candidatus Micrarchaeota archaeon]